MDGGAITAHTRAMSYAITGRLTRDLPNPRQIHATAKGAARLDGGVIAR